MIDPWSDCGAETIAAADMFCGAAYWRCIVDVLDDTGALYQLVCGGALLAETDSPPTNRGNRELAAEYCVSISPEMLHQFAAMGEPA